MFFGMVETVWGMRQLYGFTASGHSHYALTGSFFNPGPYAGYFGNDITDMLISLFEGAGKVEIFM